MDDAGGAIVTAAAARRSQEDRPAKQGKWDEAADGAAHNTAPRRIGALLTSSANASGVDGGTRTRDLLGHNQVP